MIYCAELYLLNSISLLITITPNDRLFDQFSAVSYKVGKLSSFDYAKMSSLLEISPDSKFNKTSITKNRDKSASVCAVFMADASEYLWCPGALFPHVTLHQEPQRQMAPACPRHLDFFSVQP